MVFPHLIPACISLFTHTFRVTRPSYSPWFDYRNAEFFRISGYFAELSDLKPTFWAYLSFPSVQAVMDSVTFEYGTDR
jgi:hypothetical protein